MASVAVVALAAGAVGVALGHQRAVGQQHAREVATRGRGEDGPAVAALVQQWQAAAVIDVRVAQYDRVDVGWCERKRLAIAVVRTVAALDHAAVEQQRAAPHGQDVAGTGDFARRAVELQLHANRLRRFASLRVPRLPGQWCRARRPDRRAAA